MKRVCTIGSATYDMFIMYEGADTMHLHQKKSSCTYMLLPQGSKIDIPRIHYATGGGGTNSAVGLARLNLSVDTYFRTGHDYAGDFIRSELAKQNINTSYCPIDETHSTALSIIIPSIEHDHVALCNRAANRQQTKDAFPIALIKDLDLLFIGPLGGRSQELLPYVAPAASNAGASVALNPSMIQLTNNEDQFIQTLNHVDTILVNAHESGYLMKALLKEDREPLLSFDTTHNPSLLSPYIHFKDISFTIKDVIHQLLACGPSTIVITNGAEGVYVANQEMLYFHPSILVSPTYSLGAGDAFSSGFLGAQMHDYSLQQALLFGMVNAHSVIQYPDAKEGLLSLAELKKRVKDLGTDNLHEYKL